MFQTIQTNVLQTAYRHRENDDLAFNQEMAKRDAADHRAFVGHLHSPGGLDCQIAQEQLMPTGLGIGAMDKTGAQNGMYFEQSTYDFVGQIGVQPIW